MFSGLDAFLKATTTGKHTNFVTSLKKGVAQGPQVTYVDSEKSKVNTYASFVRDRRFISIYHLVNKPWIFKITNLSFIDYFLLNMVTFQVFHVTSCHCLPFFHVPTSKSFQARLVQATPPNRLPHGWSKEWILDADSKQVFFQLFKDVQRCFLCHFCSKIEKVRNG